MKKRIMVIAGFMAAMLLVCSCGMQNVRQNNADLPFKGTFVFNNTYMNSTGKMNEVEVWIDRPHVFELDLDDSHYSKKLIEELSAVRGVFYAPYLRISRDYICTFYRRVIVRNNLMTISDLEKGTDKVNRQATINIEGEEYLVRRIYFPKEPVYSAAGGEDCRWPENTIYNKTSR